MKKPKYTLEKIGRSPNIKTPLGKGAYALPRAPKINASGLAEKLGDKRKYGK